MEIFIKESSLVFCSLLAYVKILNLKNLTSSKIARGLIFSFILTGLTYILKQSIPNIEYLLMIVSLILYAKIATGTKIGSVIIAMTISIGISYGSLLIAAVIAISILHAFLISINMMWVTVLASVFQIILIILPFKIKRFKKGFIFLQKERAGITGIIISGIILVVFALIGMSEKADYSTIEALIIIAIVCIAALILWWRRGLTKLYRERMKELSIKELEAIIEEKDRRIQTLTENNEFLAKIIHRDNKLLPSMYSAVRTFLNVSDKTSERHVEGKELAKQLEKLILERSDIFLQNQREHKILPTTGLPLVDNTLNYMLSKATESGIQLDLTVTWDLKGLTDSIVSESRLQTLLADLIENAIIATSCSQYKRILVIAGTTNDAYELIIQDSGMPFEIETLANLGVTSVTTHGSDGGSGIGYMTAFEILREVNASLVIVEYTPKALGFTKKVKIRFDGKCQYIIDSYRVNEIRMYTARSDVIFSG